MLEFWTNYTLVDPDISQWFKQGESKEANVSAGRWGDASVCLFNTRSSHLHGARTWC